MRRRTTATDKRPPGVVYEGQRSAPSPRRGCNSGPFARWTLTTALLCSGLVACADAPADTPTDGASEASDVAPQDALDAGETDSPGGDGATGAVLDGTGRADGADGGAGVDAMDRGDGATGVDAGADGASTPDGVGVDSGAPDSAAEDASTPDGSAQDGSKQDGSAQDGSAQDGSAQDGAAQDAALTDSLASDAASGDGASDDAASGDGATGDGATGDGATGDGATGDGATGDGATGDGATGDGASGVDAGVDGLVAASDTSASDGAALPWPADAWAGPVKPVVQANLPAAAFVDVSGTYGLSAKASWAYCAAVGFIDADGSPDAVFIQFEVPVSGGAKTMIRTLLGGKQPKVVTSPFNTALLYPDGGCALADLDGDGDGDLLVGGSSGLAYYAGDGKGGFKDVSAARLPAIIKAKVWSIAVDDFNGDGRLDIYLGAGKQPESCSGVTCGHTKADFICTYDKVQPSDPFDDDRLLLQQISGAFTDATPTWKPTKGGIATSVASYDLDGDGRPEMLVGDDFGGHHILPNLGGKSFGKPIVAGFQAYAHAMGWGIGDLNGDGATDLVVADVGPLLVYAGTPGKPLGPWTSLPVGHPIAGATWHTSSWVPHVVDLDHDGDLDIYLGVTLFQVGDMGKTMTDCTSSTDPLGASDLVMLNDGKFNFTVQAIAKGKCGRVAPLAQSLFDFDGDGDLDVIQVRADCGYGGGKLRFLRNDLKKAGASVVVRLVGAKGNRDAIGANLSTTVGGAQVRRRVVGSVGIGSSGARTLHIGLGKATATGPVTVTWPGGKQTQHAALKAGANVTWKAP